MKHITRLALFLTLHAALLVTLRGAPLAGDTPAHASPDFAAPVLLTLPAGAEPTPADAASAVALPEGWQAIALTASLEVWVRDSDLNKELDVRPGSALHAGPSADSTEMGRMVAGDIAELRGIQGKWMQIHITKKTTGYINTTAPSAAPKPEPVSPAAAPAPPAPAPAAAPAPPDAPAPAAGPSSVAVASQPAAAAPVSPPVQPAPPAHSAPPAQPTPPPPAQPLPPPPPPPALAQPAPPPAPARQEPPAPYAPNQTAVPMVQRPLSVSQQGGAPLPAGAQTQTAARAPDAPASPELDAGIDSAPRTFEGTFASTRRAFMPRRPYDFQLTAPDGKRLVYVDLGKVTVSGQFESYIGRVVIVHGTIAAVPGASDIVVIAETLQVK